MARKKQDPYKSREFEDYVLWKSIPSMYRGRELERLKKFGIENAEELELSKIRTQGEFAKKYKIDIGTLSDWNKRITEMDLGLPYRTSYFHSLVQTANLSLAFAMASNPNPNGVQILNNLLTNNKLEIQRRKFVSKEEVGEIVQEEIKKRKIEETGNRNYSPRRTTIDENVQRILRETYGKHLNKDTVNENSDQSAEEELAEIPKRELKSIVEEIVETLENQGKKFREDSLDQS